MQIPAFFASHSDGGLTVSDGRFSGVRAVAGERAFPFGETVSRGIVKEIRAPAVVVDCDSLTKGVFSEKVLKGAKVRGADVWFMTYIETVDDVFDCFTASVDMLMAPYHTVLDEDEFRDIHSVSDSVVPAVFVRRGYAMAGHRRKEELEDVLEKLTDIGFYKTCIVDTDGSLSGYEWEGIYDGYPAAVPFVDSDAADGRGFPVTVRPFPV